MATDKLNEGACHSLEFRGKDLTGADFQGADLVGADFRGANLKKPISKALSSITVTLAAVILSSPCRQPRM